MHQSFPDRLVGAPAQDDGHVIHEGISFILRQCYAIYFRGVPLYGENEEFKTKLHKHTLTETLRFNMELKLYTCKVYTPTQAHACCSAR